MKISIDIPDNQVFSFIELTKNSEYKITIDELDKLPKEFIEILNKREKTPSDECISARDLIAELKKRRDV